MAENESEWKCKCEVCSHQHKRQAAVKNVTKGVKDAGLDITDVVSVTVDLATIKEF